MDLTSMLNSESVTNLEEDAFSTYRRLSTGSASASPGQSPNMRTKVVPATETFRAPSQVPGSLPRRASSDDRVPGKRKSEQLEPDKGPLSNDSSREGNKRRELERRRSEEHERLSAGHMSTTQSVTLARPVTAATAAPAVVQPPRPRLDFTYDGQKPADELTSLIKDAILYYLTQEPRTYGKKGIEIEAKLGKILDRQTEQRLHDIFPIDSTTLLHHAYDQIRFESNMTEEQHAKFNKHLNDQVESRNPKHPMFNPIQPLIKYTHTKLTDRIYAGYRDPSTGLQIKPRVTQDDRDGSVVESISKENITHLHILCPRMPFDIRLSINLEHSLSSPPGSGEIPIHRRKKDRLSYNLPKYRIDLTKVESDGGHYAAPAPAAATAASGQEAQQRFELEVELTDLEHLKKLADAEYDGRPCGFTEVIAGFMGSVLRLNRFAAK